MAMLLKIWPSLRRRPGGRFRFLNGKARTKGGASFAHFVCGFLRDGAGALRTAGVREVLNVVPLWGDAYQKRG